jgi:hypothetical protein
MPPPVTDDLASAALRHAHDSRELLERQRLDNAVYLAGYAVECS